MAARSHSAPTGLGAEPALSIVVPTLNEARALPGLLDDLAKLRVPTETIVVDGGSADATRELAIAAGACLLRTPGGRGAQLRIGAAAARGRMLCFLHADVHLDRQARRALERLATDGGDDAYAFTLRIASTRWRYRLVERGTALRARLFKFPYGDQGLVLARDLYHRAGGFPDIAIMEDVAFVMALRRMTALRVLPEHVTVSPRRWEQDGVLRRTFANWALLGAFLAGIAPDRLARAYRPHSGVDGVA